MTDTTAYARADRVSFRYGRRAPEVLSGLSFAADRRPTVVIGPNGAGKSTLLRLLAGQLAPTSGRVVPAPRTGFAAQHTVVLPGFKVAQQVRYAGWLAGRSRDAAAAYAPEALALADLSDLADRPATALSGGERARLGIACALAARPEFLILDEPSASLDPLAREGVRRVLTALVAADVGMLVTSHTATDVGEPFERLVVLDAGQVRFDGGLAEFFAGPHRHPVVADLARVLRDR